MPAYLSVTMIVLPLLANIFASLHLCLHSLVRYVTTGGPSDNRDWYRTSHEAMITRHVCALRKEVREVKNDNAACMERIGTRLICNCLTAVLTYHYCASNVM